MMERNTTEVGLDTSEEAIQVAMLLPGGEKAVESGDRERAARPFTGWRSGSRARRLASCGSATRRDRAGTRCSGNFERQE